MHGHHIGYEISLFATLGNRDLRQRKVLEAAKSKGANVFEAFSNTPPQW